VKRALVLVVFAACGDTVAVVDAGAPDGGLAACVASYSGNFMESSASPANCATASLGGGAQLGHHLVSFDLPVQAIATSIKMTFDLGGATALGLYTSETITGWSVLGVQTAGNSICVYTGGNAVVPQGSFTLELDALDVVTGTARGTLLLAANALSYAQTVCGPYPIENVRVRF
jgi:hypothetical protein